MSDRLPRQSVQEEALIDAGSRTVSQELWGRISGLRSFTLAQLA